MTAPCVLLVEPDPNTRSLVEGWLLQAGYAVQSTNSGDEALRLLSHGGYALLITDLCLGPFDGLTLLVGGRARDPELETIVLTADPTLASLLAAANHGMCAYLQKPVAHDPLMEQVAAAVERRQLRRTRDLLLQQMDAALRRIAESSPPAYLVAAPPRSTLRIRELELDLARRRVRVAGRPVELSPLQFNLLHYLARNADAVQSPERIVREVLGYVCDLGEARELMKSNIHRLRSKIELDPRSPTYLVSVRGAGYMLASEL